MTTRTMTGIGNVGAALRAIAFAAIVWGALAYIGVRPDWVVPIAALAVGALSLTSASLATAAAVAVLTLPLVLVNPVVGIAAAVVGVASLRYLGAQGGRPFLVIALTIAGVFVGPAWAGVVLAGLLLGPGEGALAAVLAAVAVQAFGLATGRPSVGMLLTGGPGEALMRFPIGAPLTSPHVVDGVIGGINAASMNAITSTVAGVHNVAALCAQPALWGAVAMCAGLAADASRRRDSLLIGLGAAGLSVAALAAGTAVLRATFGAPVATGSVAAAAGASLAIVLVGTAVSERYLGNGAGAPRVITSPSSRDDAEVDELLRLIANAEETLAERHTVEAVVLMSDMQSFSSMTEEDGSLQSAKAIQRHRDLLLPVVERWGGRGKPSGGDGLVAAFDRAGDALEAAAEMQRVLAEFNGRRTGERALNVRIGVASGEVVVDRSGRPFIGVGLNLAARVMSLAEGGQSLATSEVAVAAGNSVATKPMGTFRLKNITAPVDVVELLRSEAA